MSCLHRCLLYCDLDWVWTGYRWNHPGVQSNCPHGSGNSQHLSIYKINVLWFQQTLTWAQSHSSDSVSCGVLTLCNRAYLNHFMLFPRWQTISTGVCHLGNGVEFCFCHPEIVWINFLVYATWETAWNLVFATLQLYESTLTQCMWFFFYICILNIPQSKHCTKRNYPP